MTKDCFSLLKFSTMSLIESLQNEKIKRVNRWLTKNSDRKKANVIIVEGVQENERAQHYGYEAIEFFICDEIFSSKKPAEAITNLISAKVYEKLAYRGTTEGIIGIYKTPNHDIKDFAPKENSSVIILESVEKPGNLGAILRSCEAFGVDALIITDPKIDFYNPNVIRSSVGCIFGMPIFAASNDETYEFLQQKSYRLFTTFMDESAKEIQNADLTGNSAILFGTEHSGLSDFWLGKAENILIPMVGSIDSLNLSNAVAISCYELLRQKKA